VLAQPTTKAEQGRAFIPFSLELGQDWNGIQAELARLVSDAKDVLDATSSLSAQAPTSQLVW
jgi:hypothetical protein